MATATDETVQAETQPTGPPPDNHDAETLARIVVLNRNVTEARERFARADLARKFAKEALEEEQAILNEFIAGLGQEMPLFDRKAEAPADDAWRDQPLEALRGPDAKPLSVAVIQALAENEPPLTTLGAVADWSKGGRLLTDVKGIGDAKAQAVLAVVDHYWVQHADPGEAVPAAPEADDAASAWRLVTIGELGLAERTVEVLDEHVIATVGELVALVRADAAWITDEASEDISAALDRFRNRRSNLEIPDFDAARNGTEATTAKAPKRGKKAS